MDSWRATPDLKTTVSKWRVAVYATATTVMACVLAVTQEPRDAATAVIVTVVLVLSLPRIGLPIDHLLFMDLAVAVAVWWLYGPISGAAMIALGVAAVARPSCWIGHERGS